MQINWLIIVIYKLRFRYFVHNCLFGITFKGFRNIPKVNFSGFAFVGFLREVKANFQNRS